MTIDKKRKYRLAKFALIFFCAVNFTGTVFAQSNSPYTIPRQIFIGDTAALFIPLSAKTNANIVSTTNLPTHKYIDFHKITLETNRLIIEFTPFATGELEFPLIEIGGHYFTDIKISVNSTIDRKEAITLSAPASSLAMPGTAFMLYGSMALIVSILIFTIWFFAKGRRLVSIWKEKWNRWRLYTNMRHTERRLYKALLKNVDKRIILNKLSDEFRGFLSVLTKQNCRAMTAKEIGNLQDSLPCNLPENFFTRCDNFRFSGSGAETDDILLLLKDLRSYIDAAEVAGAVEAAAEKTVPLQQEVS